MSTNTRSAAATGLPSMTSPAPIDQMDVGISLVKTAWLAMQDTGWVDDEALMAISETLELALRTLKPVRALLNEQHGRVPS